MIGDSSKIFGFIVLAPFAIMTVIGLFKVHFDPASPFTLNGQPLSQSLNLGLFVVMWNYLGWDGLSTIAGEMKNPKRDYPKTLVITLPLITACYLLPVLVGLMVVEAILQTADDEHVDLIVMSRRGLGRLQGLLVGSVSERVARHANVPVFLVS